MSTSNIVYHQLGKNGPKVPALGYGAMGLSAFYGNRVNDEESHEVIKMVRAGGYRPPTVRF
jgi:aryl-alcohol dehydrogenase-like predicted oxidoreductase